MFTASEVFDAAIQVERNGMAFYTKAAEYVSDPALRLKLTDLANAEKIHIHIFTQLKGQVLTDDETAVLRDPNDPTSEYLQAFVEGGAFNMTTDAAHAIAEGTSVKDILLFAIERERDAIVFYSGLKMAMKKNSSRETVDEIVRQEMDHLALLNRELCSTALPESREPRTRP